MQTFLYLHFLPAVLSTHPLPLLATAPQENGGYFQEGISVLISLQREA